MFLRSVPNWWKTLSGIMQTLLCIRFFRLFSSGDPASKPVFFFKSSTSPAEYLSKHGWDKPLRHGSHLCRWFPLQVHTCSHSHNRPHRKCRRCMQMPLILISPAHTGNTSSHFLHWEPHCSCGFNTDYDFKKSSREFFPVFWWGTAAHEWVSIEWAAMPMQNAAKRGTQMWTRP